MKAGVPMRLPAWVCEPDSGAGLTCVHACVSSADSASVVPASSLAENFGQSPVHHLDLAEGADHHVGGLEIAMNHAVGVGVADGLANGLEDGQPAYGAPLGRWVGPVFQDRLRGCSP